MTTFEICVPVDHVMFIEAANADEARRIAQYERDIIADWDECFPEWGSATVVEL